MIWIVLAVLFFIYGLIVSTGGSGTSFFLIWFVLSAMCLVMKAAGCFKWFSNISQPISIVIKVLIAAGIIIFILVETFVIRGFMNYDSTADLDYLIVLGAQVKKDGPSRALQFRLDRAIEYLEGHPDTVCIVSGGKGINEPTTEAAGMKRYLIEKGIPEDRILKEDQSKTTVENIVFSKRLLSENASVGIVTNNFHMARALQIARGQGLSEAAGIPSKSTFLYLPHNLLREFFAELKYLLEGK